MDGVNWGVDYTIELGMYRSKREGRIKDMASLLIPPTHPHTQTVNLRGCTSSSLLAAVHHPLAAERDGIGDRACLSFRFGDSVCKGRKRAKTIFRGRWVVPVLDENDWGGWRDNIIVFVTEDLGNG